MEMKMINFLIFVLAAIGLAHILVDGVIMVPVKNILERWQKAGCPISGWVLKMLACYQCSGWWSGLIISIMMAAASHFKWLHWLDFVVYGFAASFLSNFGAAAIQYVNLQALRGVTSDDDKK